MKIGAESVRAYVVNGKRYLLYGCWDSETPENTFDFYDLYNEEGDCLNFGDPYYDIPTEDEVKECIEFYERDI